jgi:hypothetical protein
MRGGRTLVSGQYAKGDGMGAERDALGILTADAMTEIKAGRREHASLLVAETSAIVGGESELGNQI